MPRILILLINLILIRKINSLMKSKFLISPFGNEINSSNVFIDQIEISSQWSLLSCSSRCSLINQCLLFDYDSSSKRCRLYSLGYMINSSSMTSRMGIMEYSPQQYLQYNQICENNVDQYLNHYLICSSNNQYQCPQGFFWNGTMCSIVYWQPGPQLNLSSSLLRGWTQCYQGLYAVQLHFNLSWILNQCFRSKLLLACGSVTNSSIYSIAAMAERNATLFDCSTSINCSSISNGVQWYFSSNYSWGFANQSDPIERAFCDTKSSDVWTRLCWHTIQSFDGYRCGPVIFNGSSNASGWQRAIWHTD